MNGIPNLDAIRANIFPSAHWAIRDWHRFPWHRRRRGEAPDADQINSSQAFCISFWGTLAGDEGVVVRQVAAELLGDQALRSALGVPGRLSLALEDPKPDLLNEHGAGNPTHLDAVLLLPGMPLVVESKLTEPLGGCSQVPKACTGTYGRGSDLKTKSDVACRLEVADGRRTPRRYWEVMRAVSMASAYPTGQECPFKRSGFQVMRVIASGVRMAEGDGEWRGIFAYPRTGKTRKAIQAVVDRLLPEHRQRVLHLDYRELASRLASEVDRAARGLGVHMQERLKVRPG